MCHAFLKEKEIDSDGVFVKDYRQGLSQMLLLRKRKKQVKNLAELNEEEKSRWIKGGEPVKLTAAELAVKRRQFEHIYLSPWASHWVVTRGRRDRSSVIGSDFFFDYVYA